MKLAMDKDIYLQFTTAEGKRCAVFLSEVVGISEATEDTPTAIITRSAPFFVADPIEDVAAKMGIKMEEVGGKQPEEEPLPDNLIQLFGGLDKRQLEAMSLLIKNAMTKAGLDQDGE